MAQNEKTGENVDTARIFSVIEELNEIYCDLWESVCNMESPTEYKQGVDAVGEVFLQIARQNQWSVEVLELEQAGNPICITMNPESPEKPALASIDVTRSRGTVTGQYAWFYSLFSTRGPCTGNGENTC